MLVDVRWAPLHFRNAYTSDMAAGTVLKLEKRNVVVVKAHLASWVTQRNSVGIALVGVRSTRIAI